MVNRLIPVKIKLSMPWTETSMHFSSQCLNQGVKIFLGVFFYCCYIYCMPWARQKKKKQLRNCPGWHRALAVCAQTHLPCCETLTTSCLPGLDCVGLFFQGRSDFFTSLDTFSPAGAISPFPWAEGVWLWEGAQMSSESTTPSREVLGYFALNLMLTSAGKMHACFS